MPAVMRILRRSALWLGVLAVSCVLLVLGPGQAAAHAGLEGSEPLDGEAVPTSPPSVLLRFNQPVSPEFVTTALTSGGRPIPTGPPEVTASTLVQQVPQLTRGSYVLAFRVISQDGHPVAGSMKFYVDPTARQLPERQPRGTSSPTAPAHSTETGPAVWPWLVGLGLILLVAATLSRTRKTPDP